MTDCALFDVVISGVASEEELARVCSYTQGARVVRDKERVRICGVPQEALTADLRRILDEMKTADYAVVRAGLSLADFSCAFFDMDSTLIQEECIDELAALAGVGEKVAAVTERSMRGELDFEQSLRERVALLAGAPAEIIEKAAALLTPTTNAHRVIAFLEKHGVRTYILSGGFTQFASKTAALYGMSGYVCNRLVVKDGKLTGEVTGPAGGKILDRSGKRAAMEVIAQLAESDLTRCIAGGDGANDIEMILDAGLGLAYRAKPRVAAMAPHKIVHGDFSVLADWFVESWN